MTGALMIRLNVPHPPAAATTLIVSLGVISRPAYLVVLEAAVGLLVGQTIIINRLTGVRYRFWATSRLRRSARWPAVARCSGSRTSAGSVDSSGGHASRIVVLLACSRLKRGDFRKSCRAADAVGHDSDGRCKILRSELG